MDADVQALDRVLTRLALADDSKLTAILDKLLPMILGKLTPQDTPLRAKVLAVLGHINKRLADKTILLPVGGLVSIAQSATANSFSINFALVYIERGFPRLSVETQRAVAPRLLTGVLRYTTAQQQIICRVVVQAIGVMNVPNKDPARSELFPFLANPLDVAFWLDFFLDLLLFSGPTPGSNIKAVLPSGLSVSRTQRLIGKEAQSGAGSLPPQWMGEDLARLKVKCLRLVMDLFTENQSLPHLIVATSDLHHEPRDLASAELKHMNLLDLEDTVLVLKLLGLLQVDAVAAAPSGASPTKAPNAPLPRSRLKPKCCILLLQYLSRSKQVSSPSAVSAAVKVVFEYGFGGVSGSQVQGHGILLGVWIFTCLGEKVPSSSFPLTCFSNTNTLPSSRRPTVIHSPSPTHPPTRPLTHPPTHPPACFRRFVWART
jgi:proteasome component ECM29